ncbi:WD40 repeat-like protein [Suillus decipiens]|nr:WD40 repeat-like protein [Suillus decipiens]
MEHNLAALSTQFPPRLQGTISPDGCHIVSGSLDKTIRVWDMGTGKPLGAPLEGHTAGVNTVVISSDGNRIVSGSDDQTVRVWDMKTGKAVGPPFRGHTAVVWSVAISRDGKRIVSGSKDTTIRVWDVEFLDRHQLFEVPAICFSSNPIHALHSAAPFLSDSESETPVQTSSATPAPSHTNEDGWINRFPVYFLQDKLCKLEPNVNLSDYSTFNNSHSTPSTGPTSSSSGRIWKLEVDIGEGRF